MVRLFYLKRFRAFYYYYILWTLLYNESRTRWYFNLFHDRWTANSRHWRVIRGTNILCVSLMKKKNQAIVWCRLSTFSSRTTRTGTRSFYSITTLFANSRFSTSATTLSDATFSDRSRRAFLLARHNRFPESETWMSQDWPCLDIDQ